MYQNLKFSLSIATLAAVMAAIFSFAPDPPFPGGVSLALASTKLSQIANGNLVSAATDKAVAVRSGTTDVLISVGSLAGENLTAVIPDNGSGGATIGAGQVTDAMLQFSSTAVNGVSCALGSACTVTAASGMVVGTTTITNGTNGDVEFNNNGVLGELSSGMTIAGHLIQLGSTQTIACGDLSNGATGCSTAVGTAATQNTGTSGGTLPFLNGNNVWSGTNAWTGNLPALANGSAAMAGVLASGAVWAGQGSTNDLEIQNKNGADVCKAATGTTTLNCTGLQVGGTAVLTGNQTITLSSDATGSGAASIAVTLPANVVTNSKAAQGGANTMKGNWTAGTANEADNTMPSCSDSGGNHLNYVNGTGVTCGTSDLHAGTVTSVTFTGDGVLLSNVASGAVTTSGTVSATIAQAASGTVLGNATGAAANPTYTAAPVLGSTGVTAGILKLASSGATSAVIAIDNYAATSAYNYNLPATAGALGSVAASGGGGTVAMTWDAVIGNTASLQLTSGTHTSGDCTKFDASGNLVDAGAACSTAAGTVTSITFQSGLAATAANPITASGFAGLASTSNNTALCNNSGATAVPTSADCVITGTGSMPLASGALMSGLSLTSQGNGVALYIQSGAGETGLYSNGILSSTGTINIDNGNMQQISFSSTASIGFSTPTHPGKTLLLIKEPGTGYVYTVTGCKWAGGSTITFSSTASAIDVISIAYDGTNYYCMGGAAFQ